MSPSPDADVDRLLEVRVPTGPAAPEDVLATVKAEGLRRRTRRHRRNAVLAALGLAIVAVPAVTLLPSDGDGSGLTVASEGEDSPATADTRPPRTTAATSETTTPTTVVEQPTETTIVAEPSPTTGPRPTAPPTTAPAGPTCRNSTDPACGEFRWDPEPGPNQPVTASFVDAPATATVGEEVTFAVAWSDPDAPLTEDYFSADGVVLGRACTIERRYGPWTPPDPAGGSGELTYRHTFTSPGTYEVTVSLATGQCNEPYASEQVVSVTVTVS